MLITLSELFAQSFEKYSKYFAKTFPYLAVLLAAFLLRYGAGYLGVFLAFNTRLSDRASDFVVLILLIILGLIGFWGTVALTKRIQNLDQNQPSLPFKLHFKSVKKYLLPVFFVTLINILLIALGGVLLVIPGVIFFIWYYFSNYIVVFEDKKGLSTLSESKNLIVGRWWPMAWRIGIPKIVFSLLSGLIAKAAITIFILIFSPSPIVYDLAFEFIAGLIAIFMLPLFLWQDTTLYYSAKQTPVIPPANQ
ncbi:MAG: hypothetical protein NT034_02285 [Candidatus Magasanikbacteria bacterium]|nr:hypothetical protein [Candidatus Magasanikbacteria bacterium]